MKMHLCVRPGLLSLLLILLVVGSARQAGAQTATPPELDAPAGAIMFTLRPEGGADVEPLRVDIAAGERKALTVVFSNLGEQSVSLRTYVADAHTNTNGGFGMGDESTVMSPPTTWADYAPMTYDLEPGTAIERTFDVAVPPDTSAGQFVFGIALQTAEPVNLPGTTVFNQILRKAIPVIITVPGPVQVSSQFGEPTLDGSGPATRLIVPIENTGNIRIWPAGTLTLSNEAGEVVVTAPISMLPVYAGDNTTLEVALPSQLAPATYSLDLELRGAEQTGWTASLHDVPITLAVPASPEAAPLVAITHASVTPVSSADSGRPPQYAEVKVEVANGSNQPGVVRLTLIVKRDGEAAEAVPLSPSLALVTQATTVEQRYIPENGWQEGTYTFSLVLTSIDPTTGVEAVLATVDAEGQIVVP